MKAQPTHSTNQIINLFLKFNISNYPEKSNLSNPLPSAFRHNDFPIHHNQALALGDNGEESAHLKEVNTHNIDPSPSLQYYQWRSWSRRPKFRY